MAKFLVTNPEQDTEIPFLRGILIRSLQDAGLPFDDAHRLASEIREELSAAGSVSTRKLRATVLRHLRQSPHRGVLERYRAGSSGALEVLVEYEDGHRAPFSRGYHQRRLESCAISPDEAAALTQTLYKHLVDRTETSIRSEHLDGLTHQCLEHELGTAVAARYLVWTDFVRSGRPLVLLIGGTAGCGKTTTATSIASRLDIVRTQSTDMLREVMRLMVPERLLPVLHRSSFQAWRAVPGLHDTDQCTDAQLADGYRAQAELLSVACEGVVHRALRERVSVILEGVHIYPSFLDKIQVAPSEDALVVPVMLAVLDKDELRKRIRGRGRDTPQRRAERYLKHFKDIWQLQSVLLSDADRVSVPIIENSDKEKVFREIMRHVIGILDRDFSLTAAQVFRRRHLERHRGRTRHDG